MGIKVLMLLGYYEPGGFKTVVDSLSKYLRVYDVDVTVAARVIRVEPPKHVNLIKLKPKELPQESRYYDVIHIHTSYPYTKIAVEQGLRNTVFTWHGYTPTIYVPGIRNKLINIALRFAYRRILPKIPFITAVSNYANIRLRKLIGISGKVVSNGVDLELFKPCHKREHKERSEHYPVILNLTAYNNLKGKDLLIKSFKVIKRKYPKATLIAVGLDYNSFSKDIIRMDYIQYNKVPQLYCSADFYLLTSKHESFGLPIIEAFATGTPVIAYDKNDARREHINNSSAGLLFRDTRTLIQAVDEVLNNWESYSMRGIEYARKFDWRTIAKEYVNIYRKVIESGENLEQKIDNR
jgi:glycosyltransferase involved in cell wall biosynthesis